MSDRLQSQALEDQARAMQALAQGDFASLLARYGEIISRSGFGGTSPLMAAPIVKPGSSPASLAK
jgi:hypothetical protein